MGGGNVVYTTGPIRVMTLTEAVAKKARLLGVSEDEYARTLQKNGYSVWLREKSAEQAAK